MIVVLTGAPGAGKGTQCQMLVDRCGYKTLSTGAALRKHVKERTPIGLKAKEVMDRGDLVSDDILIQILEDELASMKNNVVILDGYPRNVDQAKTLGGLADKYPVKAAIQLDVAESILVERLTGRRVCDACGTSYHVSYNPTKAEAVCDRCGGKVVQRADDSPDSVQTRLKVYDENTRPVLDYYDQSGVFDRVAGEGEIDSIFNDLRSVIDRRLTENRQL